MKRTILIILTALLSVSVACSKKKSSGAVATPPPTTDGGGTTNPNNVIVGLPAPINASFYFGTANISQRTTYKNFLKAAFGYQTYNNGGAYGQNSYDYSYNYSCNLDILRWVFGDSLVDCGSGGGDQYSQYIDDLSRRPAIIQFLFKSDGTVRGLWLVDGIMQRNTQDPNCSAFTYQNNPNCVQFFAQQQIPFDARVTKLADGRYVLEAGPLVFLTTTAVSNFDVFFEEARFANISIQ